MAYQRALKLISPTKQLSILFSSTKRNLKNWSNAANRSVPLIKRNNEKIKDKPSASYDLERIIYFRNFPTWTTNAKTALRYTFSIARYYAEQRDHEISKQALETIIGINAEYIKTKGKTFIIANSLINPQLSQDNFITETLELLRQYSQIGISQNDEQQAEQALESFKNLCLLYLTIDYSIEFLKKTHANLAVSYLIASVKSAISQKMTDVSMKGLRLIKESARAIINYGDINDIIIISSKIKSILIDTAIDPKCYQVAIVAIEELSDLIFLLIISKSDNISQALRIISTNIEDITIILLQIPENSLPYKHTDILAPYYSLTQPNDTFISALIKVVNHISCANENDKNASKLLRHIEEWGEKLSIRSNKLLLLSGEKKSSLTFDIIYWITHVTKIFLTLSVAKCCSAYFRDEFLKEARFLINVFSFIPANKETILFIENNNLTEQLFDTAIYANNYNYFEFTLDIYESLLSWGSKVAIHTSQYYSLEKICYAVLYLNIILGLEKTVLFSKIKENFCNNIAISPEIKSRTSKSIKEKITTLKKFLYQGHSFIELALNKLDQKELQEILLEITNILNSKNY